MEGWTRAAPSLYPHQWSWDSAFIAIGLAYLDTRRAAQELRTLFAHQWMTGKVPHIVFNPKAPPESYYPGADHWACAASPGRATSPTVHQLPVPAAGACHRRAAYMGSSRARGREGVRRGDRLLARNLPQTLRLAPLPATFRDPERSGLVTIYHPWASGADNSPRWDSALAAVEVGEMPTYPRYDLDHVDDPSERPASTEYDRYLWLVKLIKRAGCDERAIYRSHPFLVKDVLFSAILVAANDALLEIAKVVEAPDEERELVNDWAARGRKGLEKCWDDKLNLCLDYDLRADRSLRVRTVAGFAPLIAGRQSPELLAALLGELDSPAFTGHSDLRWPVPPSTSPEERGFHPRSYWRGPVWPVANWLLWWSLIRAGETERAAQIRRASLDQIAEGASPSTSNRSPASH